LPIEKGGTSTAELQRELFRGPRDALLTLCADFQTKAIARLKELAKLAANIVRLKMEKKIN
jgi:hypothetical protein